MQGFGIGGFANPIRDIQREKIRVRQKAVHGFQPDVICINVVGLAPAKFFDGRCGCRAGAGGLGTDGQVFAVGFVPDRDEVNALLGGEDAGLQLRLRLVCKTVAHAQGEFFDFQVLRHTKNLRKRNHVLVSSRLKYRFPKCSTTKIAQMPVSPEPDGGLVLPADWTQDQERFRQLVYRTNLRQ